MSKKMILIAVLVAVLAVSGFAFEKGTKSVGGSLSLRTVNNSSNMYSTLSLQPDFTYFVADNFALELSPGFGMGWKKGYETIYSYSIGFGARYFYKLFYGGAHIDLYKSGRKNNWNTEKYLTLGAGRLFGIAQNIYLDLGLRYEIGLGKFTQTGYPSVNNNLKTLIAQTGIAIFFK